MRSLIFFLLAFGTYQGISQNLNYYFGNLHSHTGFSDGSKDSASSGISTPAGAYVFAKQSQNFDFLGVSEHNHYSSSHNPGFKLPLYQRGLDMADSANTSVSFLALFGMEWGVSSDYNGHLVIYGFDDLIGWENAVPGVPGSNYDIYNGKTDYDGIFRKIKKNPKAFCYLAHPSTTDYSTGGNSSTALANSPYNAMYDSAIVGVPLRSGNAFSTFTNYNDYPNGDYFSYYKKLLSKGYHIGMGYDHDNHNTTFGRNNAGRLVILSPGLTRNDLTIAMQQMNFYGSDDWNAKVEFTMNNNIMGAQLSGTVAPTFKVVHNDADLEQASAIKIWRGAINVNGIYPSVIHSTTGNNTLTFTDLTQVAGQDYYYFAEINQADGDWIVTSPIWYSNTSDPGPTTSILHETRPDFTFFPNPVSRNLQISMALPGEYTVAVFDISGRAVFLRHSNERELALDLSQIMPGIYTLHVSSATGSLSKKLVIE